VYFLLDIRQLSRASLTLYLGVHEIGVIAIVDFSGLASRVASLEAIVGYRRDNELHREARDSGRHAVDEGCVRLQN
jgi:hypothetical protein